MGHPLLFVPSFLPSFFLARSSFLLSFRSSFTLHKIPTQLNGQPRSSACQPGPIFTGKGLAVLPGSDRTPASRQAEQQSPLGLKGPRVYCEICAELEIGIRKLCCSRADLSLLYGPVCLGRACVDHSAGAGKFSVMTEKLWQ